jgi:hypothetical protein
MNTSLYLFPLPVLQSPPSESRLLEVLTQLEFLGKFLENDRYLAGVRFFQHITFAGCSPHLQLEMPEEGGRDFCHIRIHADQHPPTLQIATARGRPRCAICGASVPDWKTKLPIWEQDSSRHWRCGQCGQESAIAELDWRGYGVGARCRIEILQVYPGEAMPGDSLMQQLADVTGRVWQHAWASSL